MTEPIHTIPLDDLIEHDASDDCPCGPTASPAFREDGSCGWSVVHHALDGREFAERGKTIPTERTDQP